MMFWLVVGFTVVFLLAWMSVDDSKGNEIRLDEMWMWEDDADEDG